MRPARLSLFLVILLATVFVVPLAPQQHTRAYQHWSEIKLWASYWSTERGFTSTLEMKNNRIKDTLVARVSLYFINGEEYTLESMSIAPRQTVVIDLNRVIEALPRAQRARLPREGTVEVEYEGPNSSALMGSVSVTNPDQGIAWSFFLYPGYRGLSNAPLQGLFWFPTRKTDGVVILHNTSETSMIVRPRIQVDGANHLLPAITLRGDEVAKLDLGRALKRLGLNDASAGGVELSYEGDPDALRAHGLLFDGAGFSTQVDFNRADSFSQSEQLRFHTPRFAVGTADPVLGLPRATSFEPFLVLHNFAETAANVSAFVSFSKGAALSEIELPLTLSPGETRVLELESHLAGRLPPNVHWGGLEVRYQAPKNSMALTMVSLSKDRARSLRSVMNGVQATTREGWYWQVGDESTTLVGIQNSETEEAEVIFSLDYYIGEARHSYDVPLTIGPRSSHIVDVAALRGGQPDAEGDVVPPTVSFGGYRAVKLRQTAPGALTTEALIINRKTKTYLTVYNTGCCQFPYTDPAGMSGPIGSSGNIFTFLENLCTGEFTTAQTNYQTGNTGVATVSSTGHVNFVGVGSTSISGSVWYMKPWQTNPETGEVIKCKFGAEPLPPCSISVTPLVSSITPARGLIGATTSVTIQGNGFASGATINAGTGITATVNAVSTTQIQASFNVSTSAPAGNHSVTVTVSGKQSNSVNFSVQVPHHLQVISDINGTLANCPSIIGRQIKMKVVDSQNFTVGLVPVQENFETISQNSCGNGQPVPSPCANTDNANSEFTDTITVNCNSAGGSCGYTINWKWQWCPYGGSPVSVGTLNGDVRANQITVNGVSTPNGIPAGTTIQP